MTLEEFNNIPFDKRYQVVAFNGTLLAYKNSQNLEERLFDLKDFMVTVKFDPEVEIYTDIKAFK